MKFRTVFFITMLALGVVTGFSDLWILQQTAQFFSSVFINIFKCLSIPVISLSIIVTLSGFRQEVSAQKVWKKTLRYTFGTTFIAAVTSFVLYIVIHPHVIDMPQGVAPSMHAQQFDYFAHLAALIPESFLEPYLHQQVFGVLIISILFGLSIDFIPDEAARHTVIRFFKGIHGLLMVITRWVIAVIPLGLFGFLSGSIADFRHGKAIGGLAAYLLVVILANLIQGFVVLPLWLRSHGIKPFEAMKKMLPALSIAFFSKSSVGTLPVTMDRVEKSLGVKPEISRFVLPLCTSLNMNGCAAFIFATVIYLMQNHGIVISYPMMGLWVIVATIAAIGNAGVPMGCFFLSASLLSSMNVPLTLMGIILPFYTMIDMLETALNVWSDSCVVKIVNDKA